MVDKEVEKLLSEGIIYTSTSAWSSPTVLVKKKDGTPRLCVDYRRINGITAKDAYPLPRIDDILDSLVDAEIFTTLDATSGYHQIPVSPKDICKTAFQTRSGLYEYTRMPFGLSNAPAAFQRTVDSIFREERGKFGHAYLDDIIIFSKNRPEHEKHLEIVYKKLKDAGIILKKEKCHFFQTELTILGYKVSKNRISPLEDRVKSIKDFPIPKTIKELRSFLGITSYCRNFMKDLSSVSAPLCDILKGDPPLSREIQLSGKELKAFEETKNLISDQSALAIPDFNKPFILTTDASGFGISGILSQINNDGREQAVCFFSKKLSESQEKYSATQRELLAAVESMKNFKSYLIHKRFKLRTDHQALTALKHTRNQDSIHFRWSLQLSKFDFDVEYIKGENNPADALSRVSAISVSSIKKPNLKIIGDDKVKTDILREYHDALGHASAGNMSYNIGRKYEWKGMHKDIERFTQSCKICIQSGNVQQNTEYRMIKTNKPGEIVEIDVVGPMPQTFRGSKFLITCIDHFSKFAVTQAVTNKQSFTIENFVRNLVIPNFPKIECILSDSGCEFTTKHLQRFAKEQDFKWNHGSPYHPQTQGAVERFNDTILKKLKKISDFGKIPWDSCVAAANKAYNASFNRSIGCSPLELLTGEIQKFPIDESILSQSYNYALNKKFIGDRMKAIKLKYEKEFSGARNAKEDYQIGDKVARFNTSFLKSKLEARWELGFRISKILCPGESFVLTKNSKEFVTNKIHIKRDLSAIDSSQEGSNTGI